MFVYVPAKKYDFSIKKSSKNYAGSIIYKTPLNIENTVNESYRLLKEREYIRHLKIGITTENILPQKVIDDNKSGIIRLLYEFIHIVQTFNCCSV